MILEDEKKKIILKRLRKSAMEIFFIILLISLSGGIFIMFVLGFLADIGLSGGVFAGELVAIVIFLGRLDDILIVVCVLVECLKLEKSETRYYIVKASDIKPSPWLLSKSYKTVVYEYEGKSRIRIIWADVMIRRKDHRLLLLVPENKHKNIYAFPLVNFVDVMN
ncbi:MAG: hypothetical protein K2K96_07550 [Lachnospiraceae bacterium]|nr:hypothetical protein [Lachnospiraceae bacterium]